jgi:glycosyltransferase involved in cell wall biosynthesis
VQNLDGEFETKYTKIYPYSKFIRGGIFMKIALVAWGYVPKPPLSHSVLTVINEYKNFLEKNGHQADIFNQADYDAVIEEINNSNYDFVHLHAYNFVQYFNQKLKQKYCFSCHDGYLLKADTRNQTLYKILPDFLNAPGIIAYSHPIKEFFQNQGYSGHISVLPNGVDTQKVNFQAQGNNKAICLGWIQPRKQQRLLANVIDGKIELDFVGPLDDPDFKPGTTTKYLGIWSLPEVYRNLTQYNCLVLISDGEAAPLVVLEALAAGLCIVVSESASANLHPNKFIRVLPDDILRNPTPENQEIVCQAIKEMIEINQAYRQKIVNYVKEHFDFNVIIQNYIQIIEDFKKVYA